MVFKLHFKQCFCNFILTFELRTIRKILIRVLIYLRYVFTLFIAAVVAVTTASNSRKIPLNLQVFRKHTIRNNLRIMQLSGMIDILETSHIDLVLFSFSYSIHFVQLDVRLTVQLPDPLITLNSV